MFFTFVSWCVLGGARLRGRVARSSVAVAYGGAVARLGEWSARLWLPVAVLRVACVGLAGYFLWSPGPLERLGFAGESLWFYDAVAWAVACSAVSFAVSLHGFVVRRVLRAIAIAGLLALVPIAVFAGAAYLHFSLDVFDPVRVVQFRVAWDEGHSVNRVVRVGGRSALAVARRAHLAADGPGG